jgi:hypothetical protein
VTINRSGSTYRSAGVIDAGYLYPGATNTFSNSTLDHLNFGATDSFTVLTIVRQWTTVGGNGGFMGKLFGYGTQPTGWNISTGRYVINSDGSTNVVTEVAAVNSGTLSSIIGIRKSSTIELLSIKI